MTMKTSFYWRYSKMFQFLPFNLPPAEASGCLRALSVYRQNQNNRNQPVNTYNAAWGQPVFGDKQQENMKTTNGTSWNSHVGNTETFQTGPEPCG